MINDVINTGFNEMPCLLDYSGGIGTFQLSEHTSAGICPLLNSIQKAREEESSIFLLLLSISL